MDSIPKTKTNGGPVARLALSDDRRLGRMLKPAFHPRHSLLLQRFPRTWM
jgi:hypothetical protein